jgi:predicted nucleotidyltransferase
MTTQPVTAGQPRLPLAVPRNQIADFCRRNHIRWLALFGSAVRDDFRPDSDVDVLVEFEPGTQVTFFTLSRLQRELESIFARPVDFVMKDGLKRRIRDSVLASAQVLYAN